MELKAIATVNVCPGIFLGEAETIDNVAVFLLSKNLPIRFERLRRSLIELQ